MPLSLLLNFQLLLLLLCCTSTTQEEEFCRPHENGFPEDCHEEPHELVLELHSHDERLARQLADEYELQYIGSIGDLRNHFVYKYTPHAHRDRRKKRETSDVIDTDTRVKWHAAQVPRKRVKRDFLSHETVAGESTKFKRQTARVPWPTNWPDPFYQRQWYLHKGASGGWDMNVQAAWQKGYSGKGVAVSILDDGIQRDHVDIAQNYDPQASYDVNDDDSDPTPQDNGDNKHGTRCAGEVAAVAGNNACGVGIAFNASIGGVRMLDGPVSDKVEAASLALNQQHIDVYSASWGPDDDGATFDGPGPLARRAFQTGITSVS